jgi:hypothetical protein
LFLPHPNDDDDDDDDLGIISSMATEFQLLIPMVDLPPPSPTVLLAKLRLWLSQDFIGVNPSCRVAARATDVPDSEFCLRAED